MNTIALAVPAGLRPPRGWIERARETAIGRAVAVSLVVHALALAFVPGLRDLLPAMPAAERIDVVLRPQAKPAPAAPPVQEIAKPQLQPRPQPAPEARQRRIESRDHPVPAAEPPLLTAPAAVEPAAPVVSQAARALEPAPLPEAFKPAPAPVEPPRPAPAAEGPSDALLATFGSGFKSAIDKNRRYPRLAQDRGWQGTATVLVKVLPGGRLGDVTIAASSGHSLLDDTAREMVKGAPLPPLPEGLRNHAFELRIPVEFRLV